MSKKDNTDADEENTEFSPVYQSGRGGVDHNRLGAAGEDHALGQDPIDFTADMSVLIRKVADDLYESWRAPIREYLANAETATLRVQNFVEGDEPTITVDELYGVDENYEPRIEVTWDRAENRLTIRDNGIGIASQEMREIFTKIGNSASRDTGKYSGQFGMGVLSFVKLIGLDNSMVMTTHSRQTDENYSSYISLAGPEPIMGQMPEDQYGTKFQFTPKTDQHGNLDVGNIRAAVEEYAEWMRVKVLYTEYDGNGNEVYNEDWGAKSFKETYGDDKIVLELESEENFVAYASDDASGETLLLSMPIDRNADGDRYGSRFQFDVRFLDESGKIIKSDQGFEGLMTCTRGDYENMLLDARQGYITEGLLTGKDVVAQQVASGPNEGSVVVEEAVLNSGQPIPPNNYITPDELEGDDEPGEATVIFGDNKGRVVVDETEWNKMPEGRAEKYVPEDKLQPFDPKDESGDLTLPEPTSDRDRLQSHEVFWEWLGNKFDEQFTEYVVDVFKMVDKDNDPVSVIKNIDTSEVLGENKAKAE